MSSGRDEADERFAAVWDERMRGRVVGRPAQNTPPSADANGFGNDSPPLGRDRPVDTDLADDLRIADLLRQVGASTPGPDREASARMRANLMAAITQDAPVVETTRVAAAPAHGTRRASRRGAVRPGDGRPGNPGSPGRAAGSSRPRSTVRRLLSTTVAGVACILALGAVTVLLSRGALPGDMLYGLKRASESTEIGLTSGQEAKARKHLDVAALRLDEIGQMIERDSTTAAGTGPTAAGLGDSDASLITDNLRAFDEQTRTGSKLLLGLVGKPSAPSAGTLTDWARAQQGVLTGFSPSLPAAGREQAATSQRLLGQLQERAAAFRDDPSCSGGPSDELGPLPSATCRSTPSAAPVAAPETTSTAPSSSTSRSTTSTEPTTTTTESPTTSAAGGGRGSDAPAPSTEDPAPAPAPVQVPLPVPGLPKVELPPLLPGLPGLSLG